MGGPHLGFSQSKKKEKREGELMGKEGTSLFPWIEMPFIHIFTLGLDLLRH